MFNEPPRKRIGGMGEDADACGFLAKPNLSSSRISREGAKPRSREAAKVPSREGAKPPGQSRIPSREIQS